jgi:hypothetical protein
MLLHTAFHQPGDGNDAGRRYLQLNVDSEPWLRTGTFYVFKILILSKVRYGKEFVLHLGPYVLSLASLCV